ncbi:MAG: acyl-CoA synthetase [Acidimicrobiales bacterium mtb01]|nr:AMP-binding protein [Actinomycetota bacterium]TEX45691.1 MAG: acyl-CoA synthetase [Acidimicrobiales bacterium mtb01]
MTLHLHAGTHPDRPAVVDAETGAWLTYAQVDDAARQLSAYLASKGLSEGDSLAVVMDNDLHYLEVVWAGLRSGLRVTPVNSHLRAEEAAYIIQDCAAKAVIASARVANLPGVRALLDAQTTCLVVGGDVAGYLPYEAEVANIAPAAVVGSLGDLMLYSSGTTGKPKGVRRPPSGLRADEAPLLTMLYRLFGFSESTVYLSAGPLYHAAPIGALIGTSAIGGTTVLMRRFDPTDALQWLAKYKITHSQWVPTMFVRMLKLPASIRDGLDLSSHRFAVHAGAPCPVHVKHEMMEWWGPILHEYYGGSEGNGFTYIGPDEWLAHPGSVGKPLVGSVHITDEDGNELAPGTVGSVFFSGGGTFEYHGDEAKTAKAHNHRGWSTLGDIGYVDEDGYLYLTDRAAFTIIRGGVNVYPQEAEDVLVQHAAVADCAVLGVPDDDLGERVVAVVELVSGVEGSAPLAEELITHCTTRLSKFKCPEAVYFVSELPRMPSGKLAKHALKDLVAATSGGE